MRFYVGTYSQRGSKGIYVYDLDPASGALALRGTSDGASNPSFLALHSNGKYLYAVEEGPKGGVAAFALEPTTGVPKVLNHQPSRGSDPCYVAVDPAGRHVLIANYSSGSLATLPIAPDGRLQPVSSFVQDTGASHVDAGRQEAPHAHMIRVDPGGKFAVAADLGCDKLFVFHYDARSGALTPNRPPAVISHPGSGPRHFAFSKDGRFVYVIHELGATISAYKYSAATGAFSEFQTEPTLPAGWKGANKTAEIVVHPSGKFLYGSNRGHDSIAIYALNPSTGAMKPLAITPSGGKTPRGFAISPDGKWLVAAHQDSDNVVVFRLDPATGALTPAGIEEKVPAGVCVVFA